MKQLILIIAFLSFGLAQAQENLLELQKQHDQQTAKAMRTLAQEEALFQKAKEKHNSGIQRLSMFKDDKNRDKERKRLEKQLSAANERLKTVKSRVKDLEKTQKSQIQAAEKKAAKKTNVVYGAVPSLTTNEGSSKAKPIQYSALPADAPKKAPANRFFKQTEQSKNQANKQKQSFGALVNNKNASNAQKLKAERKKLDNSYKSQKDALKKQSALKKNAVAQNAAKLQQVNQKHAKTVKQLKRAEIGSEKKLKKNNALVDAHIKKKEAALDKKYNKKRASLDSKIKKADKKVQKDISKDKKKKKSKKRRK